MEDIGPLEWGRDSDGCEVYRNDDGETVLQETDIDPGPNGYMDNIELPADWNGEF